MVAYTSKFEPEAATGAGWRNTGYNYDDAWARRPSESRESDDWHSAYDYDLFSTAVRFQGENSTLIPLHLGTTYQDNRSGMLKYMYDAEGIGSFVHCDDNGNVIALTNGDGNGELSATYDYDPFGNFIRGTGTAAALNPYRFSAKYHDDVLDLYYYGFRFYSPGQGRFLNRDPIGEMGGLNLYAFVLNNPVNLIDILGLNFISPPVEPPTNSPIPTGCDIIGTPEFKKLPPYVQAQILLACGPPKVICPEGCQPPPPPPPPPPPTPPPDGGGPGPEADRCPTLCQDQCGEVFCPPWAPARPLELCLACCIADGGQVCIDQMMAACAASWARPPPNPFPPLPPIPPAL